MNSFYLTHPSFASSTPGLLSRMRLLLITIVVSIGIFIPISLNAQVIAWDFNGAAGNEVSSAPTTFDANINFTNLVRGSGISGTSLLPNSFSSGAWDANATQALAEAANEYFQFSVSAKPGYTLSLTSVNYKYRRTTNSPNKGIWKYSLDGTNYIDISPTLTSSLTGTATNGQFITAPVDISGVAALQNVSSTTTIFLRFYAWGAAATSTFAFGRSVSVGENSLVFNGTVSSPGPQTFVSPSSLTGFNYLFGNGPSASDSFNVSGVTLNPLSDTISVSAPTDYEISLDNSNFVTGTLKLPYSGGALASTKVYVRLRAGRAVGSYNGQQIAVSGGGDLTNKTVTCNGSVSVFVSSSSDVLAVGGSEAATISSLVNTAPIANNTQGVQVWSFTIRDGGASAPDADALPTIVKSIVFAQSPFNSVNDWGAAINSIALFDGSTLVATGTVTATQVQFTGLTYVVPDNSSRTLTVRLSLKCPIGSVNKDGDDFGFSLSNAHFTTDNNSVSSQKTTFPALQTPNNTNVITVVGTRLQFLQQPPATVGINSNFSPAVLVSCTDVCGNLDLGFNGTVSITSTGSLLTSPFNATAVNGIASFPGLSFTAAGGPFTLTAASAGLTSAVSTPFNVVSTTTLGSGDMMIVGFDTYVTGGSDILSIANFVPLLPNTSFTLANALFDAKAPANVRQDRWYNCSPPTGFSSSGPAFAKFIYKGTNSITQGSVICITLDVVAVGRVLAITINGNNYLDSFDVFNSSGLPGKTNSTFVQFSASAPDAVFLMQGDFQPATNDSFDIAGDRFRIFNGVVFGGIQTLGTFQPFNLPGNAGGNRISRIHPSIECVAISTGASGGGYYYAYYNATRTGTHRNLIKSIAAYSGSNWIKVITPGPPGADGNELASANVCTNTFTVTSNVAPGLWGGEANTDWFNCNNWDDFTVPTSNTDVLISNSAINNAEINNNNPGAAQYNFTANARSVNIIGTTRKLVIENTNSANRNTLTVTGNFTINKSDALDMNDGDNSTWDGVINVGGNWTNNFIDGFDEGNSLINFNGTSTQTIDVPDGDVFAKLTNSNSSAGSVVLANKGTSVVISDSLNLNVGTIGLGNNTLVLNNRVTGTATLTGSATANVTIGGTAGGALGTLNFTAGARQLNNLSMNRTGASGSAILGTDLQVNNLVSISSGTLDAASTTLNGAAGLTMTGGELQLAKAGTVPELTGTYNLTGGAVHLKGLGSQTFRPVNYFNLTSSSNGPRIFQNGATTGIAGAFTRGANMYTFSGSTVNYNGSGAQTVTAFQAGLVGPGSTYHNLRLSNSGIKSLGGNTDVEADLQLNDNITLALDTSFLNLKSTATQTARIAPVSPAASISYTGAGRFVVERYFPGNRSWRMITAPVSADAVGSLFRYWQAGQDTAANNGTYITGPNPSVANGLDDSPLDNFSLRTFDQSTSSWTGVSNTRTSLISGTGRVAGVPDNIPYFMFVRGDRSPGNLPAAFDQFATVNATTIRDTGYIQYQSYIFNCNPNTVGLNRYTAIGNPYASPVDFYSLSLNNVKPSFLAWDHNLSTVGAYVTVDKDAFGNVTVTPPSSQTSIIQSKQAFIVETNGASPTVTFSEVDKSSANNLSLFRPVINPSLPATIRSNLYFREADGSLRLADGNMVQFHRVYSDGPDQWDQVRFSNINETFGIRNQGSALMIDRREQLKRGDSVQFTFSRPRRLQYRLQLEADKLAQGNLQAYLEDRYRKTSTPINMNGTTNYDFGVNADAASAAADRFYIVFRRGLRFTEINAVPVVSDVVVNWQLENDGDLQRFEVERAPEGGAFEKVAEVAQRKGASAAWSYTDANLQPGIYSYRVKGITATGVTDYTEEVRVKITARKAGMYVYPNPVTGQFIGLQMAQHPAGIYQVRLLSADGNVVLRKQLVHDAGTATEQVQCPAGLPAGTYRLEVTGPDKRRESLLVMVGR